MSMAKPLDLYYMALSHPCRLVMLMIKQLKIEDKVNIKNVDLLRGDHLTNQYKSINPDHTVPSLGDHETNLTLWESRAIALYLINKYQPKSSLYPSDLINRALVDRCVFHDASSLFPALRNTYVSFLWENRLTEQAKITTLQEKLRTMNMQFDGKLLAVGQSLTLADLCYTITLSLFFKIKHLINLEDADFPHLYNYVEGMKKTLPYYSEVMDEALDEYVKVLVDRLAKLSAGN